MKLCTFARRGGKKEFMLFNLSNFWRWECCEPLERKAALKWSGFQHPHSFICARNAKLCLPVCTPNVREWASQLPASPSRVHPNCTAGGYVTTRTSRLQFILMALQPVRTLHGIVIIASVSSLPLPHDWKRRGSQGSGCAWRWFRAMQLWREHSHEFFEREALY